MTSVDEARAVRRHARRAIYNYAYREGRSFWWEEWQYWKVHSWPERVGAVVIALAVGPPLVAALGAIGVADALHKWWHRGEGRPPI